MHGHLVGHMAASRSLTLNFSILTSSMSSLTRSMSSLTCSAVDHHCSRYLRLLRQLLLLLVLVHPLLEAQHL